jgi:hypothetical protein
MTTTTITIPVDEVLEALGHGDNWAQGAWKNVDGKMCLHGGIRQCPPASLGELFEKAFALVIGTNGQVAIISKDILNDQRHERERTNVTRDEGEARDSGR